MKRKSLWTPKSNELSRLLTRERLKKTGVTAAARPASQDPDLEALRQAVRSATAPKSSKKALVSEQVLRKLAGV